MKDRPRRFDVHLPVDGVGLWYLHNGELIEGTTDDAIDWIAAKRLGVEMPIFEITVVGQGKVIETEVMSHKDTIDYILSWAADFIGDD